MYTCMCNWVPMLYSAEKKCVGWNNNKKKGENKMPIKQTLGSLSWKQTNYLLSIFIVLAFIQNSVLHAGSWVETCSCPHEVYNLNRDEVLFKQLNYK